MAEVKCKKIEEKEKNKEETKWKQVQAGQAGKKNDGQENNSLLVLALVEQGSI